MTLKKIMKIVFIVIILMLFIVKIINANSVIISFYNKADINLENLYVQFSNDNEIYVPVLKANDKTKIKVYPIDNFVEGRLNVFYYDYNNNKHEEVLIGYIMNGQSDKVKVKIKSIDDNGVIEFTVN